MGKSLLAIPLDLKHDVNPKVVMIASVIASVERSVHPNGLFVVIFSPNYPPTKSIMGPENQWLEDENIPALERVFSSW